MCPLSLLLWFVQTKTKNNLHVRGHNPNTTEVSDLVQIRIWSHVFGWAQRPWESELLCWGRRNVSASRPYKIHLFRGLLEVHLWNSYMIFKRVPEEHVFAVTTLSTTAVNENWDYVGQNPVIQQSLNSLNGNIFLPSLGYKEFFYVNSVSCSKITSNNGRNVLFLYHQLQMIHSLRNENSKAAAIVLFSLLFVIVLT